MAKRIDFDYIEFFKKRTKYALLIPTLNEGNYIKAQLTRMKIANIYNIIDVFILDSDSKDNSVNEDFLQDIGVRAKLYIHEGKQGTAFRAGIETVFNQGYEGIITVDGNNKDSIEDIQKFINALDEGYDFIQGSRFKKGGEYKNTPIIRYLASKLILIPWVSLLAKYQYTEVASAFRGMSKNMLLDKNVQILRDCFVGYELLWYISMIAPKLKFKVLEIPTKRNYPNTKEVPTKINTAGCFKIILQLVYLTLGKYNVIK